MHKQDIEGFELKVAIFNALAHPLRLKILERLRSGSCCVCNMLSYVGAEQSNVSHHLAILKNADIVHCEKKGLEIWYEVVDKRIFEIIDILDECIIENLKKRSELLKTMAKK